MSFSAQELFEQGVIAHCVRGIDLRRRQLRRRPVRPLEACSKGPGLFVPRGD